MFKRAYTHSSIHIHMYAYAWQFPFHRLVCVCICLNVIHVCMCVIAIRGITCASGHWSKTCWERPGERSAYADNAQAVIYTHVHTLRLALLTSCLGVCSLLCYLHMLYAGRSRADRWLVHARVGFGRIYLRIICFLNFCAPVFVVRLTQYNSVLVKRQLPC